MPESHISRRELLAGRQGAARAQQARKCRHPAAQDRAAQLVPEAVAPPSLEMALALLAPTV